MKISVNAAVGRNSDRKKILHYKKLFLTNSSTTAGTWKVPSKLRLAATHQINHFKDNVGSKINYKSHWDCPKLMMMSQASAAFNYRITWCRCCFAPRQINNKLWLLCRLPGRIYVGGRENLLNVIKVDVYCVYAQGVLIKLAIGDYLGN